MVCCFAAVRYTGCGHGQAFKIDCTKDCANRCEPQEMLLKTKAGFTCQRCLEAQADEKTRERALTGMHAKLAALETQESQGGRSSHTRYRYRADSRDRFLGECASIKLAARLVEASYAENWTFEVAELVWQLKYGGCEDVKAVQSKLDEQMRLKPWDIQVDKKSNWTDGTVDASEESNAATAEDNNARVTENAGRSTDSPATTSISSRTDRELMPPPPLPIGPRALGTILSDWELMPPPPLPARESLLENSTSPSLSASQPSPQMPIQPELPESKLSMSPPFSSSEPTPQISTEAESSPRSETSQSSQASTLPRFWNMEPPLAQTRV